MPSAPLAAAPASTLPWVAAAALLFLALCALAWRHALRDDSPDRWSRRAILTGLGVALLLGLAVRIALALTIEGIPNDIASFKAWAMSAAEGGLSRFYGGARFEEHPPGYVEYPPGYVYVLWAVGRLRLLLGLDHASRGFLLLVKLPAILLDQVAALLVFRLARARASLAGAAALAALVALDPAAIHNAAVFGQVDVFLAVPLLLALVLVERGSLAGAAAVYTVAVLVKPQALLLAPLALLALWRRRDARTTLLALAASAATLLLLVLPFSRSLDPLWVVRLYARTFGSYPYASLNAANLHALVGANWAPAGDRLLLLSHRALGTALLAAVVVFSAWLYLRARKPGSVFPAALVLLAGAFFVAAMMHERYLYPAVLVAAGGYAVLRDRRLFLLFAGFSVSVLLNMALLHDLVARTGSFFVPAGDVLLRLVGFLNAALLAYAALVAIDLGGAGREAGGAARPGSPAPDPAGEPAAEPAARPSRRDLAMLALLTAGYAAVAFVNLGSLRAPQRCWRPGRAGEVAFLDLGAVRSLSRITYYMGLGQGAFGLEVSADGERWAGRRVLEQASAFEKVEWRVLSPGPAGVRWLRITAERPGAMLCEVAAFQGGERTPAPLVPASPPGAGGGDPAGAALADEAATAVYDPSFRSGMYFDEIYHARTAYELLHRQEPSENTHPPLGKAIIALGVAAFGMTPFGWRVSGTLFGVAMVPLLYLFALRLFRRPGLALLAAFLLAFDFLHFVQTRIGTIDVYAAFFVLLAYHFLHEHLRRDFWRTPLAELLRPLLLSGLAFGLGVASKWSALYGGAGMAVILLAALALRGREWLRARRTAGGSPAAADGGADGGAAAALAFPRRALAVVGWSALSFVALPAAIYLLSYVPFLLVPGPGHGLRDVLAGQGHMFRYHARMAQTHPFASPWWQWPLMLRPVWYYQGQWGLPVGTVSSIVALGNPAVWWPGIAAVATGIRIAIRRREAAIAIVLVGLASQLLPWAVAPRKLVFLYHFFPSVPFLVLALVRAAQALVDRHPAFRHAVRAHAVLVLLLFALFYPILSGLPVSRSYVLGWLRWLDTWILC